ncbi:MAG TPA: nucleoside 2-deoxyribosyltransferase [Thermoleophilaceae bacterium]|jgi:nucleoside 2-deoxyribosyltransferase
MHASAARPRCYVASALGFTDAGTHYYEHVYLPALRMVVEPVDPWALTTAEEVAEARAARREREFALEIGQRNADAIRGCTLLAAHLDGQEIDGGTAAEVGFAAALGLRCFGLRTDMRENGEPGVSVNLQVEHFIVASRGVLCRSLDALVAALGDAAK